MKKMTKLTKIFLVLVTIFSQLSGTVKVLANEIIMKPLALTLEQKFNSDNHTVDGYTLTYISEKNDYEETMMVDGEEVDKTYTLELTSVFTYLDGEKSEPVYDVIENVTGSTLNNNRSSYEVAPISEYYDGVFTLTVIVYDGEDKLFERAIEVDVNNTLKGLSGYLNENILPSDESVSMVSEAKYTLTEEGEYTQYLKVNVGELTPLGNYKVVYADGTESEVMTGEELTNYVLVGSKLDLTGKFKGEYSFTSGVKVIEVLPEGEGNTYNYEYNTLMQYGTSSENDDILNELYADSNVTFIEGYAASIANGILIETEDGTVLEYKVPTIREVVSALGEESSLVIEVADENGNVLDLTDETVLDTEVKNGYTLSYTNGTTVKYEVVVLFDADGDNLFTEEDIEAAMKALINEEKVPSIDVTGEDTDEIGTITFEDVMYLNELNKENADLENVPEDNSDNLSLTVGEIPSEMYVGDTFDVSVILNTNNTEEVIDYIDGLYGEVKTLGNLSLTDVKVNDGYISYFENGKFVLAGEALSDDGSTVVTLTFMAISEGTDCVTLSGKTAKFLNIKDFAEMTSNEVVITRKASTNNNLSSLNVSAGKLDKEFDADVTVYTLTVPYDTKSVILSGELADVFATADGLIEYELEEDKTVALINVMAEDGTVKTYTVYIVKEAKPVEKTVEPVVYYYSSNNNLKLLEVESYEVKFDKNIYEYSIKVASDVTSLDIKAVAENSKARVEITGNENFKAGKNTVTIKVTAEDGSVKEYKLVVDKEETKKNAVTEVKDSSNTAEKVVIIILIVLVVLGLLYLIFKKDDDTEMVVNEPKKNVDKKKSTSKNKK